MSCQHLMVEQNNKSEQESFLNTAVLLLRLQILMYIFESKRELQSEVAASEMKGSMIQFNMMYDSLKEYVLIEVKHV